MSTNGTQNDLDLAAFSDVDFDWTRQLQSVWHDKSYHVEALNERAVNTIMNEFQRQTRDATAAPPGEVVVGQAGSGKTHLVGSLRKRVWESGSWFVLLDLVDIKEFWPTTCLGFINSLHREMPDGLLQYQAIIEKLGKSFDHISNMPQLITHLLNNKMEVNQEIIRPFLQLLSQISRGEALAHQDVFRAFLLLNSMNLEDASIGHSWLQGMEIHPEVAQSFGFTTRQRSPSEIVRGLSWIMSLTGPTMIAVDQIDAIISEYNMRAGTAEKPDDEERKARSIIEALAGGLMELHEVKYRAMTVVSCLEDTWVILKDKALTSATQRFHDSTFLKPINEREIAEIIVRNRLAPIYAKHNFTPPYPTWPFRPEAFETATALRPRRLLIQCEEHRKKCLDTGKVSEFTSFTETEPPADPPIDLDPLFEKTKAEANIERYLDPKKENELCGDLLYDVLRVYARQNNRSNDIDLFIDDDLNQKRPALHGRIRFIHLSDNDREEHYCFRVLSLDHARAFQARLKAAITASGIDRNLSFRRLFILRNSPPPSGTQTTKLVSKFERAGGIFLPLCASDLRTLVALQQMLQKAPDGLDNWLKKRRPLCSTSLFKDSGLCTAPIKTDPPDQPLLENDNAIPVGIGAGANSSAHALPLNMLSRHTAILAGSGSGKTVLLRRIIEEAVLHGIPAIVLDTNNDLARLDDRWPERPAAFNEQDAKKAARYHECAEVVIWTPRLSAGNPLVLASLPDFSSIQDEPDELDRAIHMAAATLTPMIGATGVKGPLKEALLIHALQHFATQASCDLQSFTNFLSELPEGVSDLDGAVKMARDMAMMLKAAMAKNPLLANVGMALDPNMLISAAQAGKTRVSVINFSGLPSDDVRQAFVNQLQMALFSFIKKNPTPAEKPLTALYVMDEAQNFAPAVKTTPCKESTVSLVAQARKYGLGMIFATQVPKGIDNKIIGNSSTQFYGRMNAPATITATRELMAAKGGAADDIGKLKTGEFYFTTADMSKPVKINTPLCLSHHPQNPLSENEVVARAAKTRPS